MKRACPNCREKSIPAFRIFGFQTQCKKCGAKIGVNQIWSFLIFVPIFLVYVYIFLWVLGRFGNVGAVIVSVMGFFIEIIREALVPLEIRSLPIRKN
jgi:prepilin signal peptidase PulO-like enzyme (type II secretory pathway)